MSACSLPAQAQQPCQVPVMYELLNTQMLGGKPKVRAPAKESGDQLRTGINQVLAIVEHQQRP
jgi:hypothetical protein